MKPRVFIIAAFLLMVHSVSFGQARSVPACVQKVQSFSELHACLVRHDPEVLGSLADLEVSQGGILKARQVPNPELEVEATPNEEGLWNQEVTLVQPFELGGKRAARTQVAQALKEVQEAELIRTKEKSAIEWAVKLHRLNQIEHEKELFEEVKESFEVVSQQYKKLGRLNPEQKVALHTFEVAAGEIELELRHHINEEKRIISEVHVILGKDFEIQPDWLPETSNSWPTLERVAIQGALIQRAEAEVLLARERLKREQSQAWPDIGLGAKYQKKSDGNQTESQVGVVLEVPLPFWNRNQGGRAQASSQLHATTLKKDLTLRKLNSLQDALLDSYHTLTEGIVEAHDILKLRKRHKELHQFIRRGVISAPSIIELHRQMIALHEGLHEKEIIAVQTLWTLYALQGRIPQELLQ